MNYSNADPPPKGLACVEPSSRVIWDILLALFPAPDN